MGERAKAAIQRALASTDVWTALSRLAVKAPPGLAAYVAANYRAFNPDQRRYLSWLLGMLPVGEGGPALVTLLRTARKATARDLVNAANQARVALPADLVLRLLDDPEAGSAAVAAAGFALREPVPAHAELVRRLARLLDDTSLRRTAAIALGRMKATRHTAAIVDRLPAVSELDHESFVVALELMDDPAVVPALRDRIRRAPDRAVFGLHHALRRFTGRDPLLPLGNDEWVPAARTAWSEASTVESEEVADVAVDGDRATFVVRGGRGLIDIDYDPPLPGSSWARWGKSLLIGGERVYAVSSDCDTCETTLGLVGWPAQRAADLASTLRDRLADVPDLTPDLVVAATPLLGALRTGHYVATLVDLDLERVTDLRDSWLLRRVPRRDTVDRAPSIDVDSPFRRDTTHFQIREPLADEPPTYGIVMPTQPIEEPDAERVDTFRAAIRAGGRPAALVLAWIEDRDVEARYPERFLVGMVLDGHHKLLAYTAEKRPARALLVARLEDSGGPPDDRTRWLDEAITALRR
jgi:hypothetical protein